MAQHLESPEFLEALVAGVNEAIRTSDEQKIGGFGLILGRSVIGGADLREASAYIRDLAQLTEADVLAMSLLYEAQADVLSAVGKVPTDPNPYTERLVRVLEAVDAAGMSRDDFYARCSRLNGFGLAIEVQRNNAREAPGDHCFRLTGRGARLMRLLRAP